jgi:hypothetical protein
MTARASSRHDGASLSYSSSYRRAPRHFVHGVTCAQAFMLTHLRTSVSRARRRSRYQRRFGFLPPPAWSDWSQYEHLLQVLATRLDVPGDVLEIGVFLGGGTFKLCRYLEHHAPEKRVYAVDIFDPSFDMTPCTAGVAMARLYRDALQGRSQRDVYREVTAGCRNLTTIEGDSAQISIPDGTLCFGFVDGHHAPLYVRNDFDLIWRRLSVRGVVCFHDYGFDLPQVTTEIHRIIGEHADEISRTWVDGTMIFLERAPAQRN